MITLFSEPSLYPWFQLYKYLKNIVKKLIGKEILPYSGHFAVMRSIIIGLSELNVPFVYNPGIIKRYQHVHVFANTSAVKMAILFKRLGLIKYLTVGPNLVISSADENGLLASKHIDKVLVPSNWVREVYLIDNENLQPEKVGVWPAGVDVKYWNIEKKNDPAVNRFLFYIKRPEKNMLKACEDIAAKYNIQIAKIVHGKYQLPDFRNELTKADCVVYFVEQESQGIALSEIWATNTPTFVWNPQIWHYKMKNYKCSSAPYLTKETGAFFRDADDFEALINDFISNKLMFNPREYTISHFADIVTANRFLKEVAYES